MFGILVHWQIKRECQQQFQKYWREDSLVKERQGLIGEFLTKCEPAGSARPWITWELPSSEDSHVANYINVGLWSDEQSFLKEISNYFGDDQPIAPFEEARRTRMMLTTCAYRIGGTSLPRQDSAFVR